jgi:hypothetical protein
VASSFPPSSSPGRDTLREAQMVERDPAIHTEGPRLPRFVMDCRDKPGNDDVICRELGEALPRTSPATSSLLALETDADRLPLSRQGNAL